MELQQTLTSQPIHQASIQPVNLALGSAPEVLTRIYDEEINIAVLERTLNSAVDEYCTALINQAYRFKMRTAVKLESAQETLDSMMPDHPNKAAFVEDLFGLLDMYACLFDLDEVGVRLEVVERAMCPRFHTDKLGCRLISTYHGIATEWLDNTSVDRSKLGKGSCGLSDSESGLFSRQDQIQQVNAGDIVLLKGEGWHGNEDRGIVHRSPAVPDGEKRLVVTMDFA